MIKDILNANENITAGTTAVNKLKAVLPQCFDKDGNLYFDKLKELLRDEVDFADENYGLNFLGKSYGRLLQAMETDTVITPDEDHNKKEQNADSENIYITGDNLDALKHLLKSYENKIKCIYIDPPYNTGSDGFVYNDRFTFTKESLAQKLSISEETAERILELTNSGSASHSAWLIFMYPRLLLARDLLTEDGVIFISIDDNEQANLKLLCDDVFGEQNFLTNISRPTGTPTGGGFDGFVNELDYILIYAKNINKAIISKLELSKEDASIYNEIDDFGNICLTRPLRRTGGEDRREDRPTMYYPLINPDGKEVYPIGPTGYESRWICGYDRAQELINNNLIKWKKTTLLGKEVWQPYQVFLLDNRLKTPGNIWREFFANDDNDNFLWDDVEGNKKATRDIRKLFDDKKVFETSKPIGLIEKILKISIKSNDIILDFFSGSATTAHAVMQLNAEDGGNRKFILVQLPEATKADSEARRAGYETIDQIGRERIKRAATKIEEEHPDTTADLGFKHFRLNQLNSTQLSQIETFSPELNLVGSDDLLQNFGTQTVLATWLNRDDYGLNPAVKAEKLAGYTSYICGSHIYLLENGFDNKALMELCRKYEEDAAFATITNIVVFGYSFSYTELQALQDNVKKFSVTRNSRINVEIRY